MRRGYQHTSSFYAHLKGGVSDSDMGSSTTPAEKNKEANRERGLGASDLNRERYEETEAAKVENARLIEVLELTRARQLKLEQELKEAHQQLEFDKTKHREMLKLELYRLTQLQEKV